MQVTQSLAPCTITYFRVGVASTVEEQVSSDLLVTVRNSSLFSTDPFRLR
jgi:hypothetical protein